MKKKNKFQVLNPAQQGLLGIIKKSYSIYLWGGACNLEPVQSICGWAMSWYYKGFEPLFSRRKNKKEDKGSESVKQKKEKERIKMLCV